MDIFLHVLILFGLFLLGLMLGHILWYFIYAPKSKNKTDWDNRVLNWLDWLNRIICYYYHRLHYTQAISLPRYGPALIVSNRLDGLEAYLLSAACRRPLRFVISPEKYQTSRLYRAARAIVLQNSGSAEEKLHPLLHALQSGEVIVLFTPQAGVSPVNPADLNPAAVWLAKHTHTPLYPVHLQDLGGIQGHSWLKRRRIRLAVYPVLYC